MERQEPECVSFRYLTRPSISCVIPSKGQVSVRNAGATASPAPVAPRMLKNSSDHPPGPIPDQEGGEIYI